VNDVLPSVQPELPTNASVVVVGGGIAGLASAWQLAELGVRDVLLLEAEPLFAAHASGRNAAIFLPLEESLSAVWLAGRSRDLLDARIGTSWLASHGVALVAKAHDAIDELRYAARRLGLFHEHWSEEELTEGVPLLEGGECTQAIYLPLGGVMDVDLVLSRMRHWAARAGATLATRAKVAAIECGEGSVRGVLLADGRRVSCERVVLAAGAWGGELGAAAGAKLALSPLRRHLVQLQGEHMPRRDTPVVWRVDEGVYYRPESGGILASPCDETPSAPCTPESDPRAVEQLTPLLARLAPKLMEGATVQRSWACLRTMTNDREPAVGADLHVRGLYWCAGLGGRGMTCGAAAGELLARTVLGLAHPLARSLGLERLS
jgi:D-arginine dehydrogenase